MSRPGEFETGKECKRRTVGGGLGVASGLSALRPVDSSRRSVRIALVNLVLSTDFFFASISLTSLSFDCSKSRILFLRSMHFFRYWSSTDFGMGAEEDDALYGPVP